MRVTAILLSATLILGVPGTRAQVESLSVRVDGLVCAFCAYGLEKHLRKIDGVEGVEIDVQAGRATVRTLPTIKLSDPEGQGDGLAATVRRSVSAAGFTPGEVEAVISGRLQSAKEGNWLLVVSGTEEEIAFDTAGLDVTSRDTIRVRGVVRVPEGVAPQAIEARELLEPAAVDSTGS